MRRGRGVTPPSVERSFGLPILPYMFGLFESSQDVPGEAGRPSGRDGENTFVVFELQKLHFGFVKTLVQLIRAEP